MVCDCLFGWLICGLYCALLTLFISSSHALVLRLFRFFFAIFPHALFDTFLRLLTLSLRTLYAIKAGWLIYGLDCDNLTLSTSTLTLCFTFFYDFFRFSLCLFLRIFLRLFHAVFTSFVSFSLTVCDCLCLDGSITGSTALF